MKIIKFILAIILSFLPGIFGVIYSPGGAGDSWYNTLNLSVLNPDGWVFGVVWNILYLLLGVALYLVIRDSKNLFGKKNLMVIFLAHMLLNAMWSYVFFGLHLINMAAFIIIALIAVAYLMQKMFHAKNKTAGNIIWIYISWLCFALYLNISIIFLN